MSAIRGMYEEIMADLIRKGFGGIVAQVDHDYKNGGATSLNGPDIPTSIPNPKPKNAKTQNERTTGNFLPGGPSLHTNDEYDRKITLLLNKTPGLTVPQIQKILNSKHEVSESLRRLKQNGIIDYDQYFKFYPVQVLS